MLCPFAVHRLLPENKTQGRITPRIIIDHTQAGTGSLYTYWLTGTSLESHFWIGLDGTIEQYMDTEVRADANYRANDYAISIETENTKQATYEAYRLGAGAAAFDRDRWTLPQLASLQRLHAWLAEVHPTIRRRRCDRSDGSGLGYHSMWGTGPTDWIPSSSRGKKCPGDARIEQWNLILLPAFVGADPTEDPFMALTDREQQTLAEDARNAARFAMQAIEVADRALEEAKAAHEDTAAIRRDIVTLIHELSQPDPPTAA